MKTFSLVLCKSYNGHPNVLFMMSNDDFRLSDSRFSSNYEVKESGSYDRKLKLFSTDSGEIYQVFADYSVKLPA